MGWGRVDDKLHCHPKVDKAGVEAMGLWVLALSYAQDYGTKGGITLARVEKIVGNKAKAARYVARLIDAGLWEPHPSEPKAYLMHDFAQWNPSAETMQAHRSAVSAARAEAGRKGAAARWQTDGKGDGNCYGNSFTPGSQTDSPARAHALGLGSGSGSSRDRDLEEQTPIQPNGPIPAHMVRVQQEFWIAAYERAVRAARGPQAEPFVFEPHKVKSLVAVVQAHCRGPDRQNIDAWVERDVGEFVRAVRGDDARAWSFHGPDGLLRWHNAGRPGYSPPRPPRQAPPGPPEEPYVPLLGEERMAAITALQDALKGIGRGGAAARSGPRRTLAATSPETTPVNDDGAIASK
jgi:hypothetical protein